MPNRFAELIAAHDQWLFTVREIQKASERLAAGDTKASAELAELDVQLQKDYDLYVAQANLLLGPDFRSYRPT